MRDRQRRRAVLGVIEFYEFRADMTRNQLHAVANAQQRQATAQNLRVEVGRAVYQRALGTTRENDCDGIARRKLRPRDVVGHDLAINAELARTTRNELAILRAEIEDEDRGGHRPPIRPRLAGP